MFKVNNKDNRIRKVNDKVKNKDTVDIALVSLLLTLNTFTSCYSFSFVDFSQLPAEVVVCCSGALCLQQSI